MKRRREEREVERARQEEELSMLQRERAAMEAQQLEHKEEHFHLEQVWAAAYQHLISASLNGLCNAVKVSQRG